MKLTTIVYASRVDGESDTMFVSAIDIPNIFHVCFEPLRLTDDPMLCMTTGDNLAGSFEAQKVAKIRRNAAKVLSKQLAKYLLKAMTNNDTFNGYPIVVED